MGVSLTGSRMSMASIRTIAVVIGSVLGLTYYVYGPAVTPVMQAAATSSCNELTGGNFRSYHLEWVVGSRPHWSCWDARDPAEPPMNMGWWVTPGR
jgi:hypothetical protein